MTAEEIQAFADKLIREKRERKRRQKRAHYLANREEILKRQRAYNISSRDAILVRLRKYREKNADKFWDQQLRYKYGITAEQYLEMLQAQGGRCAICADPPTERCRLHVDHCHETNTVRQLLCTRCNTAIGLLKHDPELVRAAAAYLEVHDARIRQERPELSPHSGTDPRNGSRPEPSSGDDPA